MSPICISVINMKGGVGKTTVAAMLARRAASSYGLDVLEVDLDPQANLSQALMSRSDDYGEFNDYEEFLDRGSPSIVELFNGYRPPGSGQPSPTVLNATDVLYNVPGYDSLQLIPSRFDFADNLVSAIRPDPRRLAKLIANDFRHKDLIFIDCAPTESIFTEAAYHASGYILVPVRPEFLATIGFPLLKNSLDSFRRRNMGQYIEVLGIVINETAYDRSRPERQRALEEIETESTANEWYIFENELGYSAGFPKMMRGDDSWPGNAPEMFDEFAEEFFNRLSSLMSQDPSLKR